MRHLVLLVMLMGLISLHAHAQQLTLQPYTFISKAKDTVQAELGHFYAPLNRSAQSADSLALYFVRFKSTNPNPGAPIVYLAGGPGGSGIGTARGNRFELFMKLRAVADVIAFDQRGTGMSNVLPRCPFSAKLAVAQPLNKSQYVEQTGQMLDSCLAFWQTQGANLAAYNTTESAHDLNDLRKALGVRKISLWGISYGSHLAFAYIKQFENTLDRVVLAALEGPDHTIKMPFNTDAFVDTLCQRAATNYGQTPVYPDLKQKIKAVHQRLAKQPVITTINKRGGGIDTVGISLFDLQLAVATYYMRDPADSKKLPALYEAMYNGNFKEIAIWVMVVKRYVLTSVSPMALAMDLQSGITPARAAQVQKQMGQSLYGSAINFLLFEWMQQQRFKALPSTFRTMPTNKVKALLLSGVLDGRTYAAQGIKLAKAFKNGHHVLIDNAGHNLYMASPEVGQLVLNFFMGKAPGVSRLTLAPVPFD